MLNLSRFSTSSSGELDVIEYISAKKVMVKFVLTGYITYASKQAILSGSVKDLMLPRVFGVGFIGDGKHKSMRESKLNKAYTKWHAMMERCYSKQYQKKKPSYIGCTVDPTWHNFQNFAEWFGLNYIAGFELDKDKYGDGKLYSPSTCCFLSRSENTEVSQARKYTLKSPDGELVDIFNLSKFCRENNLTPANIHKVLNGSRNHHKKWRLANG